ncbi:MAG: DUF3089 domain-containing protein [Caulobacteraceae bacterium]|nr:DUF3089 domain-containing protein [Caulobacteraceae bacterium]
MSAPPPLKRSFGWAFLGLVLLMAIAAFVYRDDILFKSLDPKIPFQIYRPPPAPDYGRRDAWVLLPATSIARPDDPPADVFFVHPTTYDGGRNWNARAGARAGESFLQNVAIPNYAGPFMRTGRVFAPRYRQASLYAHSTQREDAREARIFAYQDVRAAFRWFVARSDPRRPIIVAGAEQGGFLVDRLLREEIATDPTLRRRLAAAYLIDAVVPAEAYRPDRPLPACGGPVQTGCVVGWAEESEADVDQASARVGRALAWRRDGSLEPMGARAALCVNPVLGATTEDVAPVRRNLGAANATGLEWGVRPALIPRQVSARCRAGVLLTSPPRSSSLKRSGSWAERKKVKPFNLFYADIEADAQARTDAMLGTRP